MRLVRTDGETIQKTNRFAIRPHYIMDDILTPTPDTPPAQLTPPAVTNTAQAPEPHYEGNSFDLYALIAGIVGVTSFAMCFSGNMLIYCLPFVPLVFGIIALRNSARALNPGRTRTLGWIGIAAGALGVFVLLVFAVFMFVYLAFFFTFMGNILQNLPRRP